MGAGFFDDMVSGGDVLKSGLCAICKGSRLMCGKARCPLMIKFYSRQKTARMFDSTEIAGSSPPAVFVGRYGYPKVDIGPLVPAEFGDTSDMDRPEKWGGKSIDEIVDFRFGLVRGKYRIDATDFAKSGKIVEDVQSLALTQKSVDVEAQFFDRPRGRIVMDDEVQPFGPSARMEQMKKSNGHWEQNLEKGFYDTDARAVTSVLEAYNQGSYISDIQKAFSVGAFGKGQNRRFVPTRWSITAVDDMIGKDYLSRTRWYPPIEDFRLYYYEGLDNRWAIILLPCTWRFELIEAWYPGTSWNPVGENVDIISSYEFFKPRTEYAEIGGCYYASRMAVNELLERIQRTAGAVICREAHAGYVMPVGVWNVRENVRRTLVTEPMHFDSIEDVFAFMGTKMDIPKKKWIESSGILTDWYVQKRIEDFYGKQASNLNEEHSDKGYVKAEDDTIDVLKNNNVPGDF